MKELILSKGEISFVDDSDYVRLSQYKFSLNSSGYVTGNIDGKTHLIHRFIMGAKRGQELDHINGNKLDNTRANLRFCSRSQNSANVGILRRSKTGFKGVCWQNRERKFQARICVNRHEIHLGYFSDAKQAALAYNNAAIKYFGEFAGLNQLEEA